MEMIFYRFYGGLCFILIKEQARFAGYKITAGQRSNTGQIFNMTDQILITSVMVTGHILVLKTTE